MNFIVFLLAVAGVFVLADHLLQLYSLYRVYSQKFKGEHEPDIVQSTKEFCRFSESYYNYAPNLDHLVKNMTDPFVKESLQTVLTGTLRGYELLRGLKGKAKTQFLADMKQVHKLRRQAFVLPVVGWMVAIASVIWLFKNTGEDLNSSLATAVTIGMSGVVYGLFLHYFLVNRACHFLTEKAKKNRLKNLIIVEGIGLLIRQKNPFEILETTNLALPSEQQLNWREVFDGRAEVTKGVKLA